MLVSWYQKAVVQREIVKEKKKKNKGSPLFPAEEKYATPAAAASFTACAMMPSSNIGSDKYRTSSTMILQPVKERSEMTRKKDKEKGKEKGERAKKRQKKKERKGIGKGKVRVKVKVKEKAKAKAKAKVKGKVKVKGNRRMPVLQCFLQSLALKPWHWQSRAPLQVP